MKMAKSNDGSGGENEEDSEDGEGFNWISFLADFGICYYNQRCVF